MGGFVADKTQAKCVFNHAFARMEKKITQPLHPLTAMRRQYQELSGQVNPSEMRRERTNYNVEQAQKKFQQDGEKTLNPNLFEMVSTRCSLTRLILSQTWSHSTWMITCKTEELFIYVMLNVTKTFVNKCTNK